MLSPHPRYSQIHEALAAAAGRRATGFVADMYRIVAPEWSAPQHLVSGQGAFLMGGRYNPPGLFRTVYCATTVTTAAAEFEATVRRSGFPLKATLPRYIWALEVSLTRVVDLTSNELLLDLVLARQDLVLEPWWSIQDGGGEALTQALGRAAFEIGFEGLLIPSAQVADGVNLATFPENWLTRDAVRAFITNP
jgi:RES domain-containing protein